KKQEKTNIYDKLPHQLKFVPNLLYLSSLPLSSVNGVRIRRGCTQCLFRGHFGHVGCRRGMKIKTGGNSPFKLSAHGSPPSGMRWSGRCCPRMLGIFNVHPSSSTPKNSMSVFIVVIPKSTGFETELTEPMIVVEDCRTDEFFGGEVVIEGMLLSSSSSHVSVLDNVLMPSEEDSVVSWGKGTTFSPLVKSKGRRASN